MTPGLVGVEIERVGLCGTDVELFTGEMAYLSQGVATYPLRIGHEWAGRVTEVGEGVEPDWIGKRVTCDTMIGCGTCPRCQRGRKHLCVSRYEIGIRDGWPGALAERMVAPVGALYEIPGSVSIPAAAMVEPGGNAVRCIRAASLAPGDRLLVFGPGTIGLLAAQFALTVGAEVQVVGRHESELKLALSLGVHRVWLVEELESSPHLTFDAVIDATNDPDVPAQSLRRVEPGGRAVFIGLAGRPSMIDSREIAFGDVTAVGLLGGSAGIAEAIRRYATGDVVPDSLVAEVIGLDEVASRLEGVRGSSAGRGPKVHVDPRIG
ncbi:MAG TPA: alcohol dehydrogenase catalytic domain-containing protein [Acidimicrobiia bacterium]|nr:alcohol dehydrogenase catalytic domain-containing protein [Acidimicrobiia bacterium]